MGELFILLQSPNKGLLFVSIYLNLCLCFLDSIGAIPYYMLGTRHCKNFNKTQITHNKKNPQSCFLLAYSWAWGLLWSVVAIIHSHYIGEIDSFPLQQVPISNIFLVRGVCVLWFSLFHFILRERTWSWVGMEVGMIWEELGGENMI